MKQYRKLSKEKLNLTIEMLSWKEKVHLHPSSMITEMIF